MSGNFDFPPASSSEALETTTNSILQDPATYQATAEPSQSAENEAPSVQARLQHLHDLLSLERDQSRAARVTQPQAFPRAPMSSGLPPDRSRRHRSTPTIPSLHPRRTFANDVAPQLPQPPPALPRPTSRQRPRARPGDRYLQRPSTDRSRNNQNPGSALRQASVRLAEASSDLRSLLDDPVEAAPPEMSSRGSHEETSDGRRAKRRKLDSNSSKHSFSNVSYGYYGQVAPGPLKMEIVSCDGGLFGDARGQHKEHNVDNVLKNDSNVYCTKSNKCNMMLRQQGETAFCLKKLVVKAPTSGFTAPVKEGMVFISMTSDGLLDQTASYDTQLRAHAANHLSDVYGLPHPANFRPQALDYLLDGNNNRTTGPQPPLAHWPSYLRTDENQQSSGSLSPLDVGQGDLAYDSAENCDDVPGEPDSTTFPTRMDVLTPAPPPFHVTTENAEDSEESSDGSMSSERRNARREILQRSRNRRRHALNASGAWGTPYHDGEDDPEDENIPHAWRTDHRIWARLRSDRMAEHTALRNDLVRQSRPQPDQDSGNVPAAAISNASNGGLQQHVANSAPDKNSNVIAPHARFFIKRNKSKCSIVFDPPVSGRYILLKLWSPAQDQNIDIQSIIAYGYGGPRYFPATELR
ncbi:MAG: hypothetical protein M4579_000493 [Chaenotheca gracillima]|nr:MAG: hypothetical protein M4579_000493 [Chaenotheca gracillima]